MSLNHSSQFLPALECLNVHDHICLIYETKEQQMPAVVSFMRAGLERHEKCLYVADENSVSDILHALHKGGIDVDSAMKESALAVTTKTKTYLKNKSFSPERMIEFLKKTTEDAGAEGFSALRATAEMSWALEEKISMNKLMEYEAKTGNVFSGIDALAMCQYNKSRFPSESIVQALHTHPHVLFGGLMCKNFYYMPPDEFLNTRNAVPELKRMLQNILTHQRSMEQLDASWHYARSLIETSPHPLMTISLDGTIADANTPMELITGLSRETLLGSDFLDYFIEREKVKEAYEKALTHGFVYNIPLFMHHISGKMTEVFFNATVYRNRQGKVQGVFAAARDVTEQKHAEESLREANRRLHDALAHINETQDNILKQERLRAVGQIAGSIAQDFHNALRPILAFTDTLLRHSEKLSDYETVKHYLRLIHASAHGATDIALRLREFYRTPEEEETPFQPLDINGLLKHVITITQPVWKEHAGAGGKSIAMEINLKESPPVYGNESELREALTNLILNAVDAMPDGGTLRVATHADNEHVTLEISDTGTGMNDEVRQQCLEPFFTTKSHGNAGLGLFMAAGVIQRHNGKIEFESEEGKGTTFTLCFPLHSAERGKEEDNI